MGCRQLDWNDLSSARHRHAQGAYGVRNEVMADGSSLYLMGARFYDPDLGRFLSPDPIGFKGGLNLYSYAANSPTNFIDPTGKDIAVIIGGPYAANPFGHAAVAVTGAGVYSLNVGGPPGTNLSDYLLDQAPRRTNEIVIIKTTPSEDQEILNYLQDLSMKIDPSYIAGNTCAFKTTSALRFLGLDKENTAPLAFLHDAFPFTPRLAAERAVQERGGYIINISKTNSPGFLLDVGPLIDQFNRPGSPPSSAPFYSGSDQRG